jgi:hypothetical protein
MCFVAKTPEEIVRQNLIQKMIHTLGYPRGLIGVEKELTPSRRVDIIVFIPGFHGLNPLLIIECKATKAKERAKMQVFDYNAVFKAPFVAIGDDEGEELMWKERGKLCSVLFLPTYESLKTQYAKL